MKKTPEALRNKAIVDMTSLLKTLAASENSKDQKRAKLLSYWISDYCRMLQAEDSFNPKKLVRYKRGQIVKAHLGFRIGSEEGGLHYAIVLDKTNSLNSKVVTIIPLTSVKDTKKIDSLPKDNIFLDTQIYTRLFEQCSSLHEELLQQLKECRKQYNQFQEATHVYPSPETFDELEKLEANISRVEFQRDRLEKTTQELLRMKQGSIALVGQITTISKQRIYDPLYRADVFHNIRVSNNVLDLIDQKIITLFTGKTF